MAQQVQTQDPGSINPTRYTEQRAPQFAGGEVDPKTGNLVNPTKSSYSTPEPATPKTLLGSIEPPPKQPGLASMVGGAVIPYAGAQLGSQIGAGASVGQAVSGLGDKVGGAFGMGDLGSKASSALGFGGSAPAAAVGLGESTAPALGSLGEVPAASTGISSLGELAGSSTIGGAIGAGLGTAAVGALSGKQIKEYAPAAIGSTVGFIIGNMILPGIGGFAGSFIGSMFCHAAGTLIRMTDGTLKAIEKLKIGDDVLLGGVVIGRGEVLAADMFYYKGTLVNGRHAVFEDGRWLRVADSASAYAAGKQDPVKVYPLVTEHHLLACEHYICSDLAETDDGDMSASDRLAKLNADRMAIAELRHAEHLLEFDDRSAAA